MNGIHDMGGMDRFGKVQPQDSEAFHELWEKKIFVANRLVRTESLNAGRSSESMKPVDYLSWGYFGRSLHSLEEKVLRNGLVTEEELKNPEGRLAGVVAFPVIKAEEVEARFQTRRGNRIQIDVPPKFRVGDRVIVKNEHPRGHTRCPRFFRGRQGQVERDRGVWPFPDRLAHAKCHSSGIRIAITHARCLRSGNRTAYQRAASHADRASNASPAM